MLEILYELGQVLGELCHCSIQSSETISKFSSVLLVSAPRHRNHLYRHLLWHRCYHFDFHVFSPPFGFATKFSELYRYVLCCHRVWRYLKYSSTAPFNDVRGMLLCLYFFLVSLAHHWTESYRMRLLMKHRQSIPTTCLGVSWNHPGLTIYLLMVSWSLTILYSFINCCWRDSIGNQHAYFRLTILCFLFSRLTLSHDCLLPCSHFLVWILGGQVAQSLSSLDLSWLFELTSLEALEYCFDDFQN